MISEQIGTGHSRPQCRIKWNSRSGTMSRQRVCHVAYLPSTIAHRVTHICMVQRVPGPGLTRHAWSHTSNAYITTPSWMSCHVGMETGPWEHPPTGGLPCVQRPMCNHAQLTWVRPCASGSPPGGPLCVRAIRDSMDPGGHRCASNCLRRPGHAHADMA